MVIFDTLQSVNALTKSGMDVQQATTLTVILKGLFESQYGNLVTKQDLDKLSTECKAEIKSVKWMLSIFGAIVMAAIVQHNFIHS